jgi:hypothetical protein
VAEVLAVHAWEMVVVTVAQLARGLIMAVLVLAVTLVMEAHLELAWVDQVALDRVVDRLLFVVIIKAWAVVELDY